MAASMGHTWFLSGEDGVGRYWELRGADTLVIDAVPPGWSISSGTPFTQSAKPPVSCGSKYPYAASLLCRYTPGVNVVLESSPSVPHTGLANIVLGGGAVVSARVRNYKKRQQHPSY